MAYVQIFFSVLLHRKVSQKEEHNNIDSAKVNLQREIYFEYKKCRSVLMKLDPCIVLKLFLNFSYSEQEYSYKLYCAHQHFTR